MSEIEELRKELQSLSVELQSLRVEFQKLSEFAEDHDIIKCYWCSEYGMYDRQCEFCDQMSCTKCQKVKCYGSWNISGCSACQLCDTTNCTLCRNTKIKCEQQKCLGGRKPPPSPLTAPRTA